MKEIISLEDIIAKEETRVAILKRQLNDHESGTAKLTIMAKASTERSFEETSASLDTHRAKLAELMQMDLKELEREEELKDAINKKNYYHYQKTRLKRDKVTPNDVKLEAMMIIDELPDGVEFEDAILVEIASKNIELHLRLQDDMIKDFDEIQKDLAEQLALINDENIVELGVLKHQIPIVVLHFSVLKLNIIENREIEDLPPFGGFPKFEDWWIDELWSSHQAYFGLYKWKSIIKNLCNSSDQKRAWEVIFANWISIKKQINGKQALGFELNYVFDTLIRKYSGLEEELSKVILVTMESIVKDITSKEDFTQNDKEHDIITPYMEFKRKKLGYVDVKSGEICIVPEGS